MLNKELKLNTATLSKDVAQVPIRNGFGEGLLAAAKADERVVGLCADLTESTRMHLFRDAFPERFIEVGITEQHMASCASGLAAMGKVPFISSYAMFSPGRNWEQIRTTICYNDVPVKIAGSHAGISVGPDGGTHQAIEDIALTRVLPRMEVVVPCDAIEARKATLAMAQSKSPTYLRLAREKTPLVTTDETPFTLGKAEIFYNTTEGAPKEKCIAIIAIGPMVHQALLAAEILHSQGVQSIVVNSATVKPLDVKTILSVTKRCGGVITAETHQIAGGLGSAVAELLATELPTKMAFIGVRDSFGQSGSGTELMEHYGLGVKDIVAAAQQLLV
jgi:transketolase